MGPHFMKTTKWFSAFESLFRMSFGQTNNGVWLMKLISHSTGPSDEISIWPSSHIELRALGSPSFIAQHAHIRFRSTRLRQKSRWSCCYGAHQSCGARWKMNLLKMQWQRWLGLRLNQTATHSKHSPSNTCAGLVEPVVSCHFDFTHYFPFHGESSAASGCPSRRDNSFNDTPTSPLFSFFSDLICGEPSRVWYKLRDSSTWKHTPTRTTHSRIMPNAAMCEMWMHFVINVSNWQKWGISNLKIEFWN